MTCSNSHYGHAPCDLVSQEREKRGGLRRVYEGGANQRQSPRLEGLLVRRFLTK